MRLESLPAALWWLLGRHLGLAGNRAGPNREARVPAPQPMTMRRSGRWLGTAVNFLIPYPLGQHEQEAVAMSKILDEVLAANAKMLAVVRATTPSGHW